MLQFDFKVEVARSGGGRTAEPNPEFDAVLDALKNGSPSVILEFVKNDATEIAPAGGKRKEDALLDAQGIARRKAASFTSYARSRENTVGVSVAQVRSMSLSAQRVVQQNGYGLDDWGIVVFPEALKNRKAK